MIKLQENLNSNNSQILFRDAKIFTDNITKLSVSREDIINSYLNSNLIKCDINNLKFLLESKISPYPMAHNFNNSYIEDLARKYFSKFSKYSFFLALSLHDWTTANFFRKKIFSQYKYSYDPNFSYTAEHDINSIANIFYNSNWFSFTPYNHNFASSFLIKPISRNMTKEEGIENIKLQISQNITKLSQIVASESRLLELAIRGLPKLKKDEVKMIARGACSYSLEIEEALDYTNLNSSLHYAIREGGNSFLAKGKIITSRTVWSFSNSIEDANKYSQGTIITSLLHPNCSEWDCAYLSPFSSNNSKVEYVSPPGAKWMVENFLIDEGLIYIYLVQLCSEFQLI